MESKTGKPRLLIVDDDLVTRELVKIILYPHCEIIMEANTGAAALELCKRDDHIDIILMDMKMPTMDGYEATRRIRAFKPETIIIAQTANVLGGDKERSLEAGCNDYISKPFTQEGLIEIIDKHWRSRQK